MSDGFGGLHSSVVRELKRLKAKLPGDLAPRVMTAVTPTGEHPVPAPLQVLLSVTWPEGAPLVNEFSSPIEFWHSPGEVETGLLPEDRAWVALALTQSQFLWVIDLADARPDDPLVYSVDHDGSDASRPLSGSPLSARLARLKRLGVPGELPRACATGDLDAVTAALRAEADLGPLSKHGLTPLHLAVISRSTEVVQALLNAGADPTAKITKEFDIEQYLVPLGEFDTDGELPRGETPLHLAVKSHPRPASRRERVPAIAAALLTAGADPNATNLYGMTPLLSALMQSHWATETESIEMVQPLLTAGADPNQGRPGTTPLIEAILSFRSVLALLLDAGADPNARLDDASARLSGYRSRTPLGIARKLGKKEIVDLLKQAGARSRDLTAE